MRLPVDLKAKVLASVQRTPSPARAPWWRTTSWLVPGSVAVALELLTAMGGLRHGEGRPTSMLVVMLAGGLAIAVLGTWGAFGRGRSALGHGRTVLAAIVLGTPVVLFASALAWNATLPEAAGSWDRRAALECLGLSLAMAVWPLVGMVVVRRASDPVHPGMTGAALGAASGAWAVLALDMWCPVSHPAHVALGHILPIALLSIAGLVLGKRVIAMRALFVRHKHPTLPS